MALAKLWTWIGQIFTPVAIAWAVYVRGGLSGEQVPEGVLISRGYWGLLVTLLAGACLAWTAALYVREIKRTGRAVVPPPNTMFEDKDSRNVLISWATVIVFSLTVLVALVLFSERYADSRIHGWDKQAPLQAGFWSTRTAAHSEGCAHGPCFAVGQRMYPSGPISGVNEYVLYVTDGGLVLSFIIFVAGLASLSNDVIQDKDAAAIRALTMKILRMWSADRSCLLPATRQVRDCTSNCRSCE